MSMNQANYLVVRSKVSCHNCGREEETAHPTVIIQQKSRGVFTSAYFCESCNKSAYTRIVDLDKLGI